MASIWANFGNVWATFLLQYLVTLLKVSSFMLEPTHLDSQVVLLALIFCYVVVVILIHLAYNAWHIQCDQMARLFVQRFSINNNESLPKSKHFLPK